MPSPAKILIVDDTPENIDVLSVTLAPIDCQLLVATSGPRALDLVQRGAPDLILLDVTMPGMDGFEVCRRLKADSATAGIPIIFVTARTDDVSAGFAAGGSDYIAKPIQADEVRARVRHQLERQRLLAELRSLNQELEQRVRERTAELLTANRQLREEINERRYMQDRLNYLATHDFVTRLHNRSALDAHVSQLLARMQLEPLRASFLLIDINQFRLINESCGCIAGDELLRQFADLLMGHTPHGDFLARLGGDKFALVCSGHADEGYAPGLARQLLDLVSRFDFSWDERTFRITASIAVVPLGEKVASFDQLMLMADETAFVARRDGNGTIQVYQPLSTEAAGHRETVNWALVLLDAMKSDRLRVHFQRIVPLKATTERGLYLETLVRLWDDRQQRLVPPGVFIGPAERFGLVTEIDRWMISQVIQVLGECPEVHDRIAQVSVNLSAVSIRSHELAGFVREQLALHHVPPRLLCFEITETEAIVNIESAREFMTGLREQGCKFSLDDFGTGFASFTYLHELPFDSLKIDGLFVRDMDSDEAHQAMVRSMVEMARLLKKPVVAEFVETSAIAELLVGLGVDFAQGYMYHRPEAFGIEALRNTLARELVSQAQ